MSEFTELNFRENHAYKYFDIYSAAENLGSEYFKNESEVFYEVKKEKFWLGSIDFNVSFRFCICGGSAY